MTTPKLYTATWKNTEVIVFDCDDDYFYGLAPKIKHQFSSFRKNLTDLQEVRVVPKDAVVIEGVTAELLFQVLDILLSGKENWRNRKGWWNDLYELRTELAKQIDWKAQLIPSATQEGGAETTCCCMFCSCNGETDLVNSDNNVCDSCIRGAHAPKPTPTVTIELTEEQEPTSFAELMRYYKSWKAQAKMWEEVSDALSIELDNLRFPRVAEDNVALTPPRPEEPKGWTVIRELTHGNVYEKWADGWHVLGGTDVQPWSVVSQWNYLILGDSSKWGISPTRLEGKE